MKNGKIRMSFDAEELRSFYRYLGSQVGAMQAILNDLTASEIAADIKPLLALQDRILEAVNGKEKA